MNSIDRGLEELRRKQAMRAMQKVAVLLDVWEQMPNDERSFLQKEYPHLFDAIKALNAAVEGDENVRR